MPGIDRQKGYTLIEVVIVIIIIAILAAAAMRSMGHVVEITRQEETKQEMILLAYAIAGNPVLISGGLRTDYGYVGDIGALPTSWDNLVTNPGYSTWNGPYIQDEFASGVGNSEFKLDSWGLQYSTPQSNSFSSTGGPTTITKRVANSIADLLYNGVTLSIADLDRSLPGSIYKDSVEFVLTYPNGTGSSISKTAWPDANGLVVIDSIPIGIHTLKVVFIPTGDTLTRRININPGHDYYADLQHYADVW